MFRRRPLRRRPLMRAIPRAFIGDGPRQALAKANKLMDTGEFLQAGEIYERLAEGAMARSMLQRAPFLFLQAGKAYANTSQVQQGIELARRGLTLLAESHKWQSLSRFGSATVVQLNELGQGEAASEIQAWLDQVIPENVDREAVQQSQRRSLPSKCPFCGATVRPNEVEWLDSYTAECLYCGSAIQNQE